MTIRNANEATEIVIGLVGPIGCNRQLVIGQLSTIAAHHKYRPVTIGMSGVITKYVQVPPTGEDQFERVMLMMDAGNALRKRTGDNSILGKLSAKRINEERKKQKDSRVVYIVDSIKHPEEVEALRAIYGQGFYLIAISSPEKTRDEYLKTECFVSDATKREILIKRDKDENLGYGQSTRDAFHLADFFLSEYGNITKTKNWLTRFMDLVFGDPFRTPTFNEYAMFMAYASSTRSADLSRQVGAVITSGTEIISSGANECPRPFGGTYWPTYDEKTGKIVDAERGRDYMRGEDRNAREKNEIISKLIEGISETEVDRLRQNIAASGIKDITEYGRVVHAEMDALLTCARRGISSDGATLYCTTYPCHNCAKHIVASGIKEVVYVEPYPKSKALELHDDSIAQVEADEGGKVKFRPFVGVGPRQFVNLFSMNLGAGEKARRKVDSGFAKATWSREKSTPRVKLFPSNYVENETLAWEQAERLINAADPISVSKE